MPRSARKPKIPTPTIEETEVQTAPVAVLDAPAGPSTAPEAQPAARPPKSAQAPRSLTFFESLRKIHADDWGTRATVYLYRLEPFTDRLRSGTVTFIMKYSEPIDQDRILIDHGSGKYKAVLTFRKPGNKQSDEIESAECEVLNTQFPPKVPANEWVEDPRNKKWAWGRPAGLPDPNAPAVPPQTSTQGVVETFRLFSDMRRSVADEIREQAPPAESAKMDPYTAAMGIAKDLLQMRSDNPMVDVLRDELKELRAEMRSERERSERLQDELRKSNANPQPAAPTGLGAVRELVAGAKELIPELRNLWPAAQEGIAQATGGRSRMNGWQEFFQPIMPEIVKGVAPALPFIIQKVFYPAPPPQANGGQPGGVPATLPQSAAPPMQPAPGAPAAAPANGTPPPPQFEFIAQVAPVLMNYLRDGLTGGQFAAWLFDGYGAEWKGLNWLNMKTAIGPAPIVAMFQKSPYWPELATVEAKFTEFVSQFVAWQPEQDSSDDAIEATAVQEGN